MFQTFYISLGLALSLIDGTIMVKRSKIILTFSGVIMFIGIVYPAYWAGAAYCPGQKASCGFILRSIAGGAMLWPGAARSKINK